MSQSANVANRWQPTMLSSSFWAFFKTRRNLIIENMKIVNVLAVYIRNKYCSISVSDPPSMKTPLRKANLPLLIKLALSNSGTSWSSNILFMKLPFDNFLPSISNFLLQRTINRGHSISKLADASNLESRANYLRMWKISSGGVFPISMIRDHFCMTE